MCRSRAFVLRLIEVMPMGDIGNEDRLDQYWPLKDLRARLAEHYTLTDLADTKIGKASRAAVVTVAARRGFNEPTAHASV